MSREILKSIIDEFEPEKFIRFFREKNRDFKPRIDELFSYNDDVFSNCIRIGKIDFQGGENMIVCSLNTDKSLTERSGKKSQYEKGKKILKETQSDSGIFIFFDNAGNFRFSLIYANYLGNKRDWSTFKRFTYFVCKDYTNKTFIQRIGDSDFSSLENIKDGFSVEKVNKEFYKEIAIKFSELVGGQRVVRSKVEKFKPLIKLPSTNDHQKMQEFAVRMIGRIVFCWFLKKKKSQNGIPLIPENLLSCGAVEKNKNYYHSVLEKLFFEVLNTKQEERKKFKGYELYKDIPFLNGGLFEPQDVDLYKPSLINSLIIPDKWIAEFFSILESYNFTIDENTSIDVELSIDPEMLGRIFENLLAEINPDTGETARKSTGSYYTPRPIVEYMVDESLKQYLITKTDIPESKLSMLLSYNSEEAEISDKESVKIINALDKIKILDPACGSGAFPIGILQKMLLILQKIDKNSSKWLEKKFDKIESSVLKKELKEKFKNENLDYIRKLGLIQDSIYGVDIQSIAVEISKLRCFLTLIVDEDVDDKKHNRGIIPLPNLEFKFVAANTLISLPEEEGSLFDESEYIKQLESLRDEFFTSYGQNKLEIESDFITIQEKMVKKLLRNGITEGRAFELAGWNPFFNEKAEWFDPKWMFGIEKGFDIVIGNPPYVRADNPLIADLRKEILNSKYYETLWEKWDLYVSFIEKGFKLLAPKGIVELIIPDAYMASKYSLKSHKFFLEKSIISRINFCSELQIFDAAVKNIIIEFKNSINPKNIPKRFKHIVDWNNFYLIPSISQDEMGESTFKEEIRNKMLGNVSNSFCWGEICYVSYGVAQSSDEKRYKGEFTKEDVLSDVKDKAHSKGYIEGKYIERYLIKKIRFIEYGTNRSPSKWRRVTFPELYEHEKIMHGGMTGAIIDKNKLMCNHSMTVSVFWLNLSPVENLSINNSIRKDFSVKGDKENLKIFRKQLEENSKGFDLKYLLAILNSKFGFKFLDSVRRSQIGFYPDDLKKLPIKKITLKDQQRFVTIVDKIISKKSKGMDATELENQIDILVYKLYELTYTEVKIVDPEFLMSEKEYEKF